MSIEPLADEEEEEDEEEEDEEEDISALLDGDELLLEDPFEDGDDGLNVVADIIAARVR